MILAFAVSATPSRAECPKFPQDVPWWSGLNHASLIAHVEKKLSGDWDEYLDKWEKERAKLERRSADGKKVVLRSAGVTLKGKGLARYIRHVAHRIDVTRCLATEASRRVETEAERLEDFETAAGGPTSDDTRTSGAQAATVETAYLGAGGVTVKIESQCKAGEVRFKVVNEGEAWPKVAKIVVHRIDRSDVVTQRRLRLAAGQIISFKFKNAGSSE